MPSLHADAGAQIKRRSIIFAVLAFVAFLIGLIVHLVNGGFDLADVTLWLLLGLDLLAAHLAFGWPPAMVGRRG